MENQMRQMLGVVKDCFAPDLEGTHSTGLSQQ